MRTSKLILDSVSEHDTTKAQARRTTGHPRQFLDHCPVPLGRMVRLPSHGELARTRTAASARSRSRLTSDCTRDYTSHTSCDISKQRARTHALPCAPSCTVLRSGSALMPRSRSPPAPTIYARLQPNLPTARSSKSLEPPEVRRGWSPLERIDERMVSRPSWLTT